jgi:hypothetical protein
MTLSANNIGITLVEGADPDPEGFPQAVTATEKWFRAGFAVAGATKQARAANQRPAAPKAA